MQGHVPHPRDAISRVERTWETRLPPKTLGDPHARTNGVGRQLLPEPASFSDICLERLFPKIQLEISGTVAGQKVPIFPPSTPLQGTGKAHLMSVPPPERALMLTLPLPPTPPLALTRTCLSVSTDCHSHFLSVHKIWMSF